MASLQLEEGGLLVPQQLVDGIITADTHPTLSLGAEVAVDESFGLLQ